MRVRRREITPFVVAVGAIFAVTVIICAFAVSCNTITLTFETTFYFVCHKTADNYISASSISDAVSSYGGAGYILELDGEYFITVSCYYSENDANAVRDSLARRELDCFVLKKETKEYSLPRSAGKNAELFKGNLNTLTSLSSLAYTCANKLDTGEYSQANAKQVLSDLLKGLKSLQSANLSNCFSNELKRLIIICEDAGSGIVYSKDLRKLQIAIADTVINIELF
ncbi:MAG: hypothetical protein J1G05_04185 [Clostridiales bacterium]|nr:hypothetical protein [Clostridiales bacterium]